MSRAVGLQVAQAVIRVAQLGRLAATIPKLYQLREQHAAALEVASGLTQAAEALAGLSKSAQADRVLQLVQLLGAIPAETLARLWESWQKVEIQAQALRVEIDDLGQGVQFEAASDRD